MRESKKLTEALKHLNTYESNICDKVTLQEIRGMWVLYWYSVSSAKKLIFVELLMYALIWLARIVFFFFFLLTGYSEKEYELEIVCKYVQAPYRHDMLGVHLGGFGTNHGNIFLTRQIGNRSLTYLFLELH